MNILDVAKRTVLAYPGSYAGMAAAMGMSPNVLRNKVSRSNETHHLSLIEAREICEHAAQANVPDPYALLRCFAADLGFQLVREGQGSGASDLSLAEQLILAQQRGNEFTLAVIHAIADGDIDTDELVEIIRKRRAACQANAEIEQTARDFSDPAPIRRAG